MNVVEKEDIRIIAYHENTPEDDDADDVDTRRSRGQSLSESGEDDEEQFQSVHVLATEDISSGTEADLTDNCAGRCCELDGGVGVVRHLAFAREVDNADHEGQKRDGENVVRVCEETDTGNGNGSDVIPSEWCSVDFGEGESSPLIGILDVKKVVVEVVVGIVASGSLLRGSGSHGCCRGGSIENLKQVDTKGNKAGLGERDLLVRGEPSEVEGWKNRVVGLMRRTEERNGSGMQWEFIL